MISLYQDPDGNTIFGKLVRGSSVTGNSTHGIQSMELLKMRIKELENIVATLNVSIEVWPYLYHDEAALLNEKQLVQYSCTLAIHIGL